MIPHSRRPTAASVAAGTADRDEASSLQLDAVFAAYPNLIFLLGPDNEFLDYRVGREMEPMLPPEAFLGRCVRDVMPEPLASQLEDALDRCRLSGATELVAYELPLHGGIEHFEARIIALAAGRMAALISPLTDQKRIEARLLESEDRLRALAAAESECVKVISVSGELLEMNAAGLTMLEATSLEEACDRSLLEYVAPEDRAAFHALHARVLAGETAWLALELRGRRGTRRMVETHATPLRDERGQVRAILALTRDITARVLAEESAGARLADLQILIDSLPVYIAFVDAELRFRVVNHSYEKWFQRSREQLVGSRVELLFDDESWAEQKPHVEAALRGETVRFERSVTRADGARFWFEAQYIPRYSADGSVAGFFSLVTDVSDRRAADGALRLSEERFRTLFEKSSEVVSIIDPAGRIEFVSPSVEALLGRPAAEIIGRAAMEFLPPEEVEDARKGLAHVASSPGAEFRSRNRIRRADGGLHTVETLTRNLLHVPAIHGFVSNTRDVTEELRLEEQLRHAQRMDSIGRLAGGVAHDFNNLLTAIMGYAELLELRLDGDPDARRELLEIQRAGERARDLTRQLLTFSRRQPLALRPLDLNAVLRECQDLLRRLLREDIQLSLELDPKLWTVVTDAAQIEQVVLNLAVNARDAMPQGGQLRLVTRNLVVAAGKPMGGTDSDPAAGDWVMIEASDSGQGMAPEVVAQIFEPFFTTKATGEGTGLGLSTVYGIVKQSGGHVQVESAPDRGSTFRVLLPRTPHDPEPPPALARAALPRGGQETLLLVEDDANLRALAARLLEGAGYRVLTAENGVQALRLAAAAPAPIQMLVSDIVMPEMNGPEIARRMRQRDPGIPVLFVSGYAGQTEDPVPAIGGIARLLSKPYRTQALLAHVRELLDRAAQGPPGGA